MPWREISITNVRLTPQESAAMAAIQGSSDIGQEVLLTTVGEFIDAIRAGDQPYTEDGTIPDLVRQHVINRCRWQWLCEFPALKSLQTAERKKLNDDAQEFLGKLMMGDINVPPPETPADTTALSTLPSVAVKVRKFDHCDEEGA